MTKPGLTPDDLAAMPDAKDYELVDGNLGERKGNPLTSLVACHVGVRVGNHCHVQDRFWVFGPDCGYQCFPRHPGRVRRAHASVILRARLPAERLTEHFVGIAPDLAVVVVSPYDPANEFEMRINDFLDEGTRLVWVINPMVRVAQALRADRTGISLREDDELDGEDVIPGFRCRLGDLFPPAQAQQPAR
jgi:Uma2 family endonuclease